MFGDFNVLSSVSEKEVGVRLGSIRLSPSYGLLIFVSSGILAFQGSPLHGRASIAMGQSSAKESTEQWGTVNGWICLEQAELSIKF